VPIKEDVYCDFYIPKGKVYVEFWGLEDDEAYLERAKDNLKDAVLASDAFFFEDTVELLRENGIKAVIQPGGSIKDENVIKLCDEYGIAMVFTSTRHFRH